MKKASLHGLTFRNDVDIDGDAVTAPITDSYKEFANGVYSRFSKPFFRKIGGLCTETKLRRPESPRSSSCVTRP